MKLLIHSQSFKMLGLNIIHVSKMGPADWMSTHYDDVIMDSIASQITSLTIVYSNVYSGADQSKHQSSASLAFVWGIHRGPVNSPHKWPVTRKIFPFDDVIMLTDQQDQPPNLKLGIPSNQEQSVRDYTTRRQGPLLLTWPYFDPSMDK